MRWFIFKSPKLAGDQPLEVFHYEPPQYIIQLRAVKYGSIVVISEEELNKNV